MENTMLFGKNLLIKKSSIKYLLKESEQKIQTGWKEFLLIIHELISYEIQVNYYGKFW